MRAMLDELMGKERDVPLEERTNRGYKFSDPEVCKFALAGLCPYGLFKNTKSDLGEKVWHCCVAEFWSRRMRGLMSVGIVKQKDRLVLQQLCSVVFHMWCNVLCLRELWDARPACLV